MNANKINYIKYGQLGGIGEAMSFDFFGAVQGINVHVIGRWIATKEYLYKITTRCNAKGDISMKRVSDRFVESFMILKFV
jgi:hypothetical protein